MHDHAGPVATQEAAGPESTSPAAAIPWPRAVSWDSISTRRWRRSRWRSGCYPLVTRRAAMATTGNAMCAISLCCSAQHCSHAQMAGSYPCAGPRVARTAPSSARIICQKRVVPQAVDILRWATRSRDRVRGRRHRHLDEPAGSRPPDDLVSFAAMPPLYPTIVSRHLFPSRPCAGGGAGAIVYFGSEPSMPAT